MWLVKVLNTKLKLAHGLASREIYLVNQEPEIHLHSLMHSKPFYWLTHKITHSLIRTYNVLNFWFLLPYAAWQLSHPGIKKKNLKSMISGEWKGSILLMKTPRNWYWVIPYRFTVGVERVMITSIINSDYNLIENSIFKIHVDMILNL